MTIIRVDPESVRLYGHQAQGLFDGMHATLVALVRDVVAVRFYGPNAVAFKTECGRMAADFGNQLHLDMAAMADAVRTSTTNIANALGGQPIQIQLDPKPITPPSPEAVDVVDVDTTALENVVPVVDGHFERLRGDLTSNFQNLQRTDWEGNAKLLAVDAVGQFTGAAHAKCERAGQVLVDFIRRQLDAVVTADR